MQIYYGCCSGNPVETIDILQEPLTIGVGMHILSEEKKRPWRKVNRENHSSGLYIGILQIHI